MKPTFLPGDFTVPFVGAPLYDQEPALRSHMPKRVHLFGKDELIFIIMKETENLYYGWYYVMEMKHTILGWINEHDLIDFRLNDRE